MVSSRPIGHTLCFYKNPGGRAGNRLDSDVARGDVMGVVLLATGERVPGFLRGGASEPYEYLSRLTQ